MLLDVILREALLSGFLTIPENEADLSLNSYVGQPLLNELTLLLPSGNTGCCTAIVVSGRHWSRPVVPYRIIRLEATRIPRITLAALSSSPPPRETSRR